MSDVYSYIQNIFRSLVGCRLDKLVKIQKKSSIRILNLSNNRIKKFEQFDFSGFSGLEELRLAENNLAVRTGSSSSTGLFRAMPLSLKKL